MKVIEDKISSQSKFMQIHSTSYEDNNGNLKEWSWVGRPVGVKAVLIIPIVEGKFYWTGQVYKQDNRLCVIKEFRIPLNDYVYEFPAGLIDCNNESIEDACLRELKEETGLNLDKIYKVSPFTYNSPGLSDESISMVFVKASGELSKEFLESSEDIEASLMSQQEVITLLETEKCIGSKAWLILNSFAKINHII